MGVSIHSYLLCGSLLANINSGDGMTVRQIKTALITGIKQNRNMQEHYVMPLKGALPKQAE